MVLDKADTLSCVAARGAAVCDGCAGRSRADGGATDKLSVGQWAAEGAARARLERPEGYFTREDEVHHDACVWLATHSGAAGVHAKLVVTPRKRKERVR